MGLDISALRKVTFLGDGEEHDDVGCHVFINPDFPERATDLKNGYYSSEDSYDFRAKFSAGTEPYLLGVRVRERLGL